MKITREQLHKVVAERLEPKPQMPRGIDGVIDFDSNSPLGFWCWGIGMEIIPVNFSDDEAASGMLLDAMPTPTLWHDANERWYVTSSKFEAMHADRKTAVLLAAKAMLQIEGEFDGE